MKIRSILATVLLVCGIGTSASAFAVPAFSSTSDPLGHWFVSTNVAGVDGLGEAGFSLARFDQAVSVTSPNRPDYIADNASGSHNWNWTYFVFRQTFDLTGYDLTTARLQFQWAADDSGEIILLRGSWIPKFRLNGGAFVNYPGSTPEHRIPTYEYGSLVDISSGFVAGLNTIDFYVEGNGMTDGFKLRTVSFEATPVPEPAAILLLGLGLTGLAVTRRRKK